MKTTTHFRQVLMLLLTLAAMAVGHGEAWASNWTVYGSNSATTLYISVNRDHQDYDETIYYRVVGLSAIDGQHFTAVSGSITIEAGHDYSGFQVPLTNPSADSYKYQVGTSRSLRVEILDRAGFILATYNWSKPSGTDVDTYTHLFDVQDVTVNSGTITVTDDNYSQAYHAVSIANYFSATAPQAYFLNIGAQLRMTLGFQAMENDDGYQHVQILVNQTSNHDEGAGDNNPGIMNYSSYMATFCHKGGSKNTTYSNYLFPVTSKGNNCGNVGLVWGDINTTNNVGELRQQYFNTNCRGSDGRLIIPTDLNTLGIRFDASGNNEDTWYAYNTVAHIQANDVTGPDQQGDIVLSPGRHAKGNIAYLSIPFSEAVNVVGASNLKLITSWGDFKYEAGAGSNVLTFRGTITADSGTELSVSSMNDQTGASASVYITDLAGNKAYINTSVSTTFSGVKVDADLATYTLDDFEQDSDGNYLISTIADLRGLASYVNAGNDATGLTFRQTNNIASIGTLAPIGNTESQPFNGTYDGGGFSLSGITINGNSANSANNNSCVGLFGVTGANAVVKNVWLRSSTIKGYKYVGGIVGNNYGVIRNCLVESSVTVAYYGTTYTSEAHGGIAGFGEDNLSIEGCRSAAKLTVSSKGGQYYGGIVGNLSKVRTTVKDCLYTGGTFGTNYASNSYGTITGMQPAPTSQILFNNYYTTDNYQAVGWSTTDVDGARKALTLTLGEGLSIVADVTTYDVSGITAYGNVAIGYDNKIYSGATQTLTLNYSGEVPAGNDLVLTVTDADNNDITATAIDGHVLTMPDADVTVTASVVPHEPGEPGYTWFLLEGQWQCQGKRFCTRCGILADLDDATVTSAVTREATCGEWGETTWTATFTKPGYETQTHTQENIEPTYQHTWGEPTYNWREEDDWNHIAYCTASRECSVCHETESEEGSVTWLYEHNRNDRTCTEGSGNGYEATFTNDVFTTQTWCTDLGPLGHDWNIPDANWDYMPCSRHITCKRCDFERTVYATMTYDVITEPTCTEAGEYFYHATFDFPTDNLPYPDANVESRYYQIPALGHEYDTDPVWAWAADCASATATFTCSRCHETQDYDATVTQEGNTLTASVTVNETTYTDIRYVLFVGSNTVHLPDHNESVYYTFTAPADGWYHIWSEGSTEYLNVSKSIGEGWWTNQGIVHIDNDFTTLIEMRADTTITFQFYTRNAVDVPVFVQSVTTHTLTVVQPADGRIQAHDRNSGTIIKDTGDVMEGAQVVLRSSTVSSMNSLTWTVTDADGQPVKVYKTSSNFFFIMPGKDVTVTAIIGPLFLDDTATNNGNILNNVRGKTGDVCIGRTLYKDGSWNTLCLPFDVTLEGSPLEGAVAKTLDQVNTTMTGTHVHLVFSEPVTTLMAGTPYIIKWDSGDDIVNPVFEDVLIETSSADNLYSSDGCTRFSGTFNARNITPDDTNLYYMTADNTLKHTAKDRTLKGFRAYFWFYPNNSDVKALTFDIDFGDGEATGIETSTKYEVQSTKEGEVYDLSGRRVSTPTKGMYIVNGKKVFVK